MRIAVTGGIAEGKSTVLGLIADLGYPTISSDAIAREVFALPDVQEALAGILGNSSPAVTPAELRAAIAVSNETRRKVNRIMHPRIRDAMDRSSAKFHEVPLLIEACLYDRYDEVWVVTCGSTEQFRRLSERLGNENLARSYLSVQLPTSAKEAFATEVIDTLQPLDEVADRVKQLIGRRFRALRA